MKKTLVLVVDRDDDFGVKAKVNTPVVGVQECLDAATAFGIADPEDSDLNALYAAVSVCLEIQEDGREADVALICGDEKVGHRSDQALVGQLEEVLNDIEPDSVVLVGDGAEDEYIYPIISSRAHVDSVRKVYVKQAPGLEGSVYILSKMLADPDKRRRFLLPLGLIIVLLSLFFVIPSLILYFVDNDTSQLSSMSGPLAIMFIGIIILAYGYDVVDKLYDLRRSTASALEGRTTPIIFICIAVAVFVIAAAYAYIELDNLYLRDSFAKVMYFVEAMVWPTIMAFVIYSIGAAIDRLVKTKEIGISIVYDSIGLASIGLVASGILDIALMYYELGYGLALGIVEIVVGVVLSILSNFIKGRTRFQTEGSQADEAVRLGPDLRGGTRGHGLLPRGGRGHRQGAQGRHLRLRPGRSG